MHRQPIDSSLLTSAGYDPERSVLELEFTSYRIYQYFDVPEEVFTELLEADSKGRYFLAAIKDVYAYQQIGRPRSRRY